MAELESSIAQMGRALVAFSGGVDSSVVAALAARALGDRALAVTAVSPALATGELDGARTVADAIGIGHRVLTTRELTREGYVSNSPQRCYHCKTELYERLGALAEAEGFDVLLSGANWDDAGDWRPGLRAAAERGVRHPLLEARISKVEVRRMARELRIPSADKPASPCLASRLPYGTPVTARALARVDAAERGVKALGYRTIRVRHHGALGRVELGAQELERARTPGARSEIVAAVRAAGYARATIDPKPFRSGSLNLAFFGDPAESSANRL